MRQISVGFALIMASVCAHSATIAYQDGANEGSQPYGGNLALTFTVNSTITVLDLGAFNASGSGNIFGTIDVAIFNTDTSAQVTPTAVFHGGGYTLIGDDVFQAISPTVLTP
jgi:hypothetical protein